ncbi:MAG: sulfotransferase [Cyclobacteriaceae bacterium]|nr:sulfotransferase [Cyclobacteriaceae bacterium HetDA_MAG_MS6]
MRRLKLARFLFILAKVLPKKFKYHIDEAQRHPFFIIGSGRNGSTLLNKMLNQQSELFLPSEQYFLGPSILKFGFSNYSSWQHLASLMVSPLLSSLGRHTWDDFEGDQLLQEVLELPKKNRTFQNLIDIIFRHHSQYGKRKLWGDSTPLNLVYFPEIRYVFPKSKYIFLLRDGRDVVASFKKGGEEAFDELAQIHYGISRWNMSAKTFRKYERSSNTILVRYEDVVSNPQKELRRISAFLDVTYEEKMLHYYENQPSVSLYRQGHYQGLAEPVHTRSIGHWRSILTDQEIEACHHSMRANLSYFGYKLD